MNVLSDRIVVLLCTDSPRAWWRYSVVIPIMCLQFPHTRAARASNDPPPLMGKHTHTQWWIYPEEKRRESINKKKTDSSQNATL